MENFTPASATAGGALIGLSAAVLWLSLGRIAGISGILGGVTAPDRGWRVAFLIGLIAAPLLYAAVLAPPAIRIDAGPWRMAAAGLLVGVGTSLGSGCTSGHGVCGLARLSRRSIVATALFMAAAGATVFVMRHLRGG